MIIRLATTNDVKTLQELNHEVFLDNYQYESDLIIDWAKSEAGEKYFRVLLEDASSCCLIAEENNQPIGYLAATHKDLNYHSDKYLEIDNMGVNPDYRSKGVGSELIKKCLNWAKDNSYQKVIVNTFFQNTKAISFYRKNGFTEIDITLQKEL